MPQKSLSDVERHLEQRWDHALANEPFPCLVEVSVEAAADSPGLRGIKSLSMSIGYPVTAVIGANGTGKSSILALCALAFHSPDDYFPPGVLRRQGAASASYTFQHFVHLGPSDPNPIGTTVAWQFSTGDRRSLKKRSRKWMHYERRPRRPVAFLGASRIVPAIEQRGLRIYFAERNAWTSSPLSGAALQQLAQIMGVTYGDASPSRRGGT